MSPVTTRSITTRSVTTECPLVWPRAIIHLDMNAFFASIEQRDFPELRGRPVAVTNGGVGTTIITCSYEARAFGIHTGMSIYEARKRCPDIVQRSTRPKVYAEVSTTIMHTLQEITPDIEVFSVDEAFLDVSHCQRLHGTPARMGQMARRRVHEVSGLLCSVGISGDKTTAKFAAKLNKPNGFTIIPPWEARQRLQHEPVTTLCGIAEGIGGFLEQHGARHCGEVGQLPVSVLARRFGNLGRRIWLMCQGEDPDPIHTEVPAPKSIGHGKVVPPDTRDRDTLLTYLLHMSEKVSARLRRHNLEAQKFFIGLKTREGWIDNKLHLANPDNDGRAIYRLCRTVVSEQWKGETVRQVQVTALDPRTSQQMDLLSANNTHQAETNAAMDRINQRFGEFALSPARLLNRSSMPNVIAPAWKPDGHRQTI